jgi:dolichol-phosphate mannosyltransferase
LKWDVGAVGTPAMMAIDLGVCYLALACGASPLASQALGFLFAAVLSHRRWAQSGTGQCSLVGTLLIYFLRGGVLALLSQSWHLPPLAALALTVLAGGLFMRAGYRSWSTGGSALDQWRALAFGIVCYAFLLRLVYAAQVELLPEETYYWNYARHLDIGYLDHPPFVAWLIRLGTMLFGDTEFGVRSGALGCGLVASVFVFRTARNTCGELGAWLALVLIQVMPFFFLSGLLMTPDAPLTAAWAATMYFLERALVAGRPRAWLWAGASLGVGLLSKYTIGLLGVVTLAFMLLHQPSRRWFRRWEPYTAVMIAAAIFAPVVIWNAQHDWASFAFQTSRRLAERPRFSLHKLIGGAIVLITPTGFYAVAAAFFRRRPTTGTAMDARAALLFRLSVLIPMTVFFFFSLRHEVKLDWTGAPWLGVLPLLAFGMAESCDGVLAAGARSRLRGAWPATVAVMLLFYGAGLYYLVAGIPGVGYPRQTELVPVGWRDLGAQIAAIAEEIRAGSDERLLVIGMDRYAIASEVAFYSPDQARSVASTSTSHLFDGVGLMYEQWFPARLQTNRTLLLVAWDAESLESARVRSRVSSMDAIHEGSLQRGGRWVRHYYYRVAHGYAYEPRGEPGNPVP